MKYRKKPIIIEAHQLTVDNIESVAAWCNGNIKGLRIPVEDRVIDIETLEGEMRADMNDYIIKGIKGEFYPCKPDIFIKSYDKIKD